MLEFVTHNVQLWFRNKRVLKIFWLLELETIPKLRFEIPEIFSREKI